MNRKLLKLLRDPKQFFLDARPLRQFWALLGLRTAPLRTREREQKPKRYFVVEVPGFEQFELIGSNWLTSATAKPKPVAVLWGFAPWKREFVAEFLANYRVAFVRGRTPWRRLSPALSRIDSPVFICWGKKEPERVSAFAQARKIPLYRMEDGFLRSSGLGANRLRPLSLVLDRKGIYFDATQESDLEAILSTYEFKADSDLMRRAADCIHAIRTLRLSKYNLGNGPHLSGAGGRNGPVRILVVGQVDSDASIKYGCRAGIASNELVRIAKKENPDAEILYKPHPEILAGFQRHQESYTGVAGICTIIDSDISLADALCGVSRVYAITSLAGFEALLHGVPVTVFGTPFYGGWGITDDREPGRRRDRRLTVEEVFAGAYLLYPKYFCPVTATPISPEQAIICLHLAKDPLFSEMLAGVPVSGFKQNGPGGASLQEAIEKLLPKLKEHEFGAILHDLIRGPMSPGGLSSLERIAPPRTMLVVFPGLVGILAKQVRYNELRDVVAFFCGWYERSKSALIEADHPLFFNELILALKKLNGRTIENVPLINQPVSDSVSDRSLLFICARALALNCEYDRLESMLERVQVSQAQFWFRLANMLAERPARSEREGGRRQTLRKYCATKGYVSLERDFRGEVDREINCIVYKSILEDVDAVEQRVVQLICSVTGGQNVSLWTELHGINKKKFGRLGALSPALALLIRFKRIATAEDLFLLVRPYFSPAGVENFYTRLAFASGKTAELAASAMNSTGEAISPGLAQAFSKALRLEGHFLAAWEMLRRANGEKDTKARRGLLHDEEQKLEFLHMASIIVNSRPQPPSPKGVVLVASMNCLNTLAMIAPILAELKTMGFAVVHLTKGMLRNEPTGIASVDQLAGVLEPEITDGRIDLEWDIDWDGRKVEAAGINLYQGIYERLSNYFRRFHIDVLEAEAARRFKNDMLYADRVIRLCLVIEEMVHKEGLPTIIVAGNSHVSPYSAFRDFALHRKNELLRFVAVNVAYENYYSNLGKKFSGSAAVVDMTLHRTCRAPFLAIRSRFEAWYEKNQDSEIVKEKARTLIAANRVARDTMEHSPLRERILTAKASGKRVICCFGKILCDLAVPYDGGPAHKDMVDWINNTIHAVDGDEELLLLIKPHPHEKRPEIALDLAEFLRDVIPEKLPANVIFLGHQEFNVSELAEMLDLAVLWNGTSSLELAALGVPVMMCSYFGRYDYPVDLLYPSSRAQYEGFLREKHYPAPSDVTRRKAAALLHYMGTEEVALPNRYSRRPITNDRVGVPSWDNEEVQSFFARGDMYVTIAAERVVEGVPPQGINPQNAPVSGEVISC